MDISRDVAYSRSSSRRGRCTYRLPMPSHAPGTTRWQTSRVMYDMVGLSFVQGTPERPAVDESYLQQTSQPGLENGLTTYLFEGFLNLKISKVQILYLYVYLYLKYFFSRYFYLYSKYF